MSQHPIVAAAADAFRRGRVVVVGDVSQSPRGAIAVAAGESTSEDIISFLATHARGLTCLAMTNERAERLGVRPQSSGDDGEGERYGTSIEARTGVSTGISAGDRARTVQAASTHDARASDIVSPGHVFPAIAHPGGVVGRRGWAEAAVDLARVAGQPPVAAFTQVLGDDAELLNAEEAAAWAETHGLEFVGIDALIQHRLASESFVTQVAQSTLETRHGEFVVRAFADRIDESQHLAISLGEVRGAEPLLTRVHSECLTGDVFGSRRCDCGPQLEGALAAIRERGRGVVLYLRQEGRGIGLANKVRAYGLQDAGRDTVEANLELGLPVDNRDYRVAAQMLLALGATGVALLTNNPKKIEGLETHGVSVVERVPLQTVTNADNEAYLATKRDKLGHLLDGV